MVEPLPIDAQAGKLRAADDDLHFDISQLGVFLGEWDLQGKQLDGPFGPAMKVTGREKVEWLIGGRFLLMRLEGKLGDHDLACLEITGEAGNGHGFRSHAFYGNGMHREWKLGVRDGVWVRTGEEDAGGEQLRTRCLTTFAADGMSQTGNWEYSREGESWTPFREVALTRRAISN
ncbi:MAG TPA: DUF1579 family protein [Hyphomonadaceae bacterium]|nr:DUF1579 family protein [Hyphomonadaceae bacterium]